MNLKQLKVEIDRDQYQVVDLMQGYTYKFEFAVEDKGIVVDLGGAIATLDMLRGDKTFIKQTDDIVIVGNTVKCSVNPKFTAVSGVCKMQLVIKRDEEIFGSWVIECRIKPSAISENDGDGENIVTVIEELNNATIKAEILKDEINTQIENGGLVTEGELSQRTNYVTPENFGGVGDGLTDDTLAIQKAVNYANTNRVALRLGNKTYLTTSPIRLYDYIHIEGNYSNDEYQRGSIIKNITTNIFDIEYKNAISIYRNTGVKITGVCFIGSNLTSFIQEGLTNLNWSQIRNCGFRNFKSIFNNLKATGCWIKDIFFNKGISVGAIGGADNHFANWFVSVNEEVQERATMEVNFDGLEMSCISNLFLTGSLKLGSGARKIMRVNNSKRNLFNRIYFDYCDEEGLYIENNSRYNVFDSCTFRGCARGNTLKDYVAVKTGSDENTFINCLFAETHLQDESNSLSRFFDIDANIQKTRLINNGYQLNRRKFRSISNSTLVIENDGEKYLNNNLEVERVGTFTSSFNVSNRTISANSVIGVTFTFSGLETNQVFYKSFINVYSENLPAGVSIARTKATSETQFNITLKNSTTNDIVLNKEIKFDIFKMF